MHVLQTLAHHKRKTKLKTPEWYAEGNQLLELKSGEDKILAITKQENRIGMLPRFDVVVNDPYVAYLWGAEIGVPIQSLSAKNVQILLQQAGLENHLGELEKEES